MRRFGLGALLAVVLVLAGCAATGPKFTEVEANMPTLQEGQGRIVFYRTSSMVGAAVQPDIRLNDQVVGTSKPGSFFFVDRPAGRYKASARTEVESSVDVEVHDGGTVYVQSGITMGLLVGRPSLTQETAQQALREMPALAYVGSIPLVPGAGRAAAATRPAAPSARPAPSPAPSAGASPSSRGGAVTMEDLRGLLPSQ
jgi:hypothetical protein